jgi:hypothetical protein
MLVKLLLYIKHNLQFLWQIIDNFNGLLFQMLFGKKIRTEINNATQNFTLDIFNFKTLVSNDLPALASLLSKQKEGRLAYFKPHGYDIKALHRAFKNPAFIMMGAFEGQKLVGYFFLRCFCNKKCFVGRLIDEPYEGRGIGRVMNDIMYNAGWDAGFRVLSTISKNNKWVMRSHASNKTMVVLKELDNDFLFVEFKKPDKQPGN